MYHVSAEVATNIAKMQAWKEAQSKDELIEQGLKLAKNLEESMALHKSKASKPTADTLPPRPPSRRRGCPSPDRGSPEIGLFHESLPEQMLPGNMTMAQLLEMVRARGDAGADRFIQLDLRAKQIDEAASGAYKLATQLLT